MWIQVRTIDGAQTQTIDDLSRLTKIETLREKIQESFRVSPDRQRLFYRGKQVRRRRQDSLPPPSGRLFTSFLTGAGRTQPRGSGLVPLPVSCAVARQLLSLSVAGGERAHGKGMRQGTRAAPPAPRLHFRWFNSLLVLLLRFSLGCLPREVGSVQKSYLCSLSLQIFLA